MERVTAWKHGEPKVGPEQIIDHKTKKLNEVPGVPSRSGCPRFSLWGAVMNEFFMNVSDAGGAPTKRYFNIDEAKAEATRLAGKEGKRVHIMKSVAACEPAPQVTWREDYQSAKDREEV